MSNYSLASGYGQLAANSLTVRSPAGGKSFLVAPSTHPNYDMLSQIFKPDPDGSVRLFNTLAAAQSGATASRGDVVYIAEGHTETITSATTLGFSKAGLQYIGLGKGSLRPTVTFTTANTATLAVSANNVRIENVIFVANFLNVAALFTLTTAAEFQLVNCEVRDIDTTHNFVAMIVTDTVSNNNDGLLIDSCNFFLLIATGATKLVSALGTNNRWTITNNYYSTPTTNAGAVMPIATGKAITQLLMNNNKFNLVNAAGTATGLLITADTAGTGYISNNQIQVATTTPLGVTAARGWVQTNNLYTHTADKSGYVMPVIDASS